MTSSLTLRFQGQLVVVQLQTLLGEWLIARNLGIKRSNFPHAYKFYNNKKDKQTKQNTSGMKKEPGH